MKDLVIQAGGLTKRFGETVLLRPPSGRRNLAWFLVPAQFRFITEVCS